MGASLPFSQIVGPARVFVGPAGEPEPAVNTQPSGNWIEVGPTHGDQTLMIDGKNVYFTDNDHQGSVMARTPEASVGWKFTLVNQLHNQLARILHNISQVTTLTGPPATSKMPFKPGYVPSEFALLIRGDADSPHGIFPGHNYLPRGVFEKSFQFKRSKTSRYEVDCEFHVLEDDTQPDPDRLGWGRVQTS